MLHRNVWPKNEEAEQRNAPVKLLCEDVWYFSSHDEDAFFEWLEKIEAVEDFKGSRNILYVYIASTEVQDNVLRDLIALFYRYNIAMSQLKIFLNERNKSWFADLEAYWYKNVFEK